MLNDVLYLWRNRESPSNPRRRVKVWVKRCYHTFNLYRLLVRSMLFRWRGASISRFVVLGKSRIEGKVTLAHSSLRTTDLQYSPVLWNVPLEAWVGSTPRILP